MLQTQLLVERLLYPPPRLSIGLQGVEILKEGLRKALAAYARQTLGCRNLPRDRCARRPAKMRFVPLTGERWLTALQTGQIDVLPRTTLDLEARRRRYQLDLPQLLRIGALMVRKRTRVSPGPRICRAPPSACRPDQPTK